MRFLPLLASLFLLILPSPLDSTPFHSHGGNLIQSKSQSQSSPALHGNGSIESRPDPASSSLAVALPVVSESNENSGKPAKEEENKSVDELKGDLYHVNFLVKEWEGKVQSAKDSLKEQVEKQNEAHRKIELMKKEHNELDRESRRIRKERRDKTADARKTQSDFRSLEDELLEANQNYNAAVKNVEKAEKDLKSDQNILDELKDRPNKMNNLSKTIAAMDDAAKQKLAEEVDKLNDAVADVTEEQRNKQNDLNFVIDKMKNCRSGDSRPICDPKGKFAKAQEELETAKEATANATETYNAQLKRLKNFDQTKYELQQELRLLKPPSTTAITAAEEKVGETVDRISILGKDVTKYSDLATNLTGRIDVMRPDYAKAEELLQNEAVDPPEVVEADRKATSAKFQLDEAIDAYNKMDGEIEPYRENYRQALKTMREYKKEADIIQKQYDAAMLKKQGEVNGAAIGGTLGGILAVVVLSVGIGLGICHRRKIYVFKPKNNDKDSHAGASTNSIGRKQAIAAKAIAARALEPEVDPYIFMTQPTPRPDRQPIPYKLSRPKDKKDKSPKPEEEESSAPPLVIEDTQPDNSGPAPGNPPAPAPAKAASARDFSIENAEHVGVLQVNGPPSTVEAPKLKVKEAVITKNSETGNDMMKI